MNQLENCQARYRSNTWLGRTRTDGPDELEPLKFDCSLFILKHRSMFKAIYYGILEKIFSTRYKHMKY